MTESPDIGIEIPLGNPEFPIILMFDELTLAIHANRLQVNVKRCEESLLKRATAVITRILKELQHTPVTATGINFRFDADAASGKLLDAFKLRDADGLSDAGLAITSTSITRRFIIDHQALNVILVLQEKGGARVDFNFHSDTGNPDEAIKYLSGGFSGFQTKALTLLKQVYDEDPMKGDEECQTPAKLQQV